MNEIVLMVFFMIEGQWTPHPQFMPIQQPNMVICEERRETAQEYFDNQPEAPEAYVACYEQVDGPLT